MSASDAVLRHEISPTHTQSLYHRLSATRRLSSELALPLSDEDQIVQANDDASPTKWHLAHTTWFFETFILKPFLEGYRIFDESFDYCFNSYYESVGARQPRGKRGLLTRPSAAEVRAYREHVDEALERLFERDLHLRAAELIELGINHEQQHQELLLTDILSLFASEPLRPAYAPGDPRRHGCRAGAARLGLLRWWHPPRGSRRRWLLLRQRESTARRAAASLQARQTAASPTASGSPSSRTAATASRCCGSPTAGPRSRRKAGAPRSTGKRRRRMACR